MASLAALNAVVSGVLHPKNTAVITYGTLHVGDQLFATAYAPQVPLSLRVANLCDFVPSINHSGQHLPADCAVLLESHPGGSAAVSPMVFFSCPAGRKTSSRTAFRVRYSKVNV